MSSLDTIRSILQNKYFCSNQDVLEEINCDNKKKGFHQKHTIRKDNANLNYLLYRFDREAFPFFKDVKGLKKMCDYILFTEWNGKLRVFAIELKLGDGSCFAQLEAASEFVRFIANSAIRIGYELDKDYKILKIEMKKYNIKQTTKPYNWIQFDANGFCNYPMNELNIDQLVKKVK